MALRFTDFVRELWFPAGRNVGFGLCKEDTDVYSSDSVMYLVKDDVSLTLK